VKEITSSGWIVTLICIDPMLTSVSASALYTRSSPQENLRTLRLDDWNSAQAFSFCLTVRLLFYTITAGDGENRTDPWGSRQPLLHDEPELRGDSFSDVPKMHIFGNKTVGFFGVDIRKKNIRIPSYPWRRGGCTSDVIGLVGYIFDLRTQPA
jgi:hypothetical protein